jgi:HEAT repeat protein
LGAAAWSAGEMGLKDAVPLLIERLELDDDSARTALVKISDARAVMPMMRDLVNSMDDKKSLRLSGFVALLSSCATKVSVDDLRTIARLSNFTISKQDYDNYGQWTEVEIDCTKARQVATSELNRRGAKG